ncbi:MAG: zinc-binding alcohol dehydrogenase family protein [Pseudomonadota bacterium]
MKAVGYTKVGSIDLPDALIDFELPKPSPMDRDLLVKVNAISVNPVDTKIRTRRAPKADIPEVLGWDAAGEVVDVGPNVTEFAIGDLVFYAGALDRPGTNSEYHLVDERIVGRKPAALSMAEAAAMPLTTLTAYEMLFDRLQVPRSGAETVLIIGGAGGVGSIAIQLLRALTNVTVIATASRPETEEWVRKLGAHHVVNHRNPLPEQIAELATTAPFFIFSTNQTQDYVAQVADVIAPQGRFGLIDDPTSFDIAPFKQKSVSIHWEFMYTRSLFQTDDIYRQGKILNEVAALVDAGKIVSTATETLGTITAENLIKAHKLIESGSTKGKLVLQGF